MLYSLPTPPPTPRFSHLTFNRHNIPVIILLRGGGVVYTRYLVVFGEKESVLSNFSVQAYSEKTLKVDIFS